MQLTTRLVDIYHLLTKTTFFWQKLSQNKALLKRGRPKGVIENTLNEPINYIGESNEPIKSPQVSRR
jgi:hypothetical protein